MKAWLPEEIAEFQERHGLKMKDIAALLGVRREHVFQLKKGTRTPSDTIRLLLSCIDREREEMDKTTGKEKDHGKDAKRDL